MDLCRGKVVITRELTFPSYSAPVCSCIVLFDFKLDLMLCDSVHHSCVDESALCVRRFGHLFEPSLHCMLFVQWRWKQNGWRWGVEERGLDNRKSVATVLVQLTTLSRLVLAIIIMPFGISCEPSRLCPQRLMARVVLRIGVLHRLAEAEGGGGGAGEAWFILLWKVRLRVPTKSQ